MKVGYLVLASERRVLGIALDTDSLAIQQALGCQIIEHGTTFHTEDQLFVSGERTHTLECRFMVAGVPFYFGGNGVLVGTDPCDSGIADSPVMTIDEFRRLITFAAPGGFASRRWSITVSVAITDRFATVR
jgi:hypothetical protein